MNSPRPLAVGAASARAVPGRALGRPERLQGSAGRPLCRELGGGFPEAAVKTMIIGQTSGCPRAMGRDPGLPRSPEAAPRPPEGDALPGTGCLWVRLSWMQPKLGSF